MANYVLALMVSTSIHRKAMTHRAPDKECSGWETNYLTVVVFEHVTRTYTYNVYVMYVRGAAISADEPGSSVQVGRWWAASQRPINGRAAYRKRHTRQARESRKLASG